LPKNVFLSYGKNKPFSLLYFCTIINTLKFIEDGTEKRIHAIVQLWAKQRLSANRSCNERTASAMGAFMGKMAILEKLVSTHQLGIMGNQILPNKTVVEGMHIAENK